MSTDWNKRAIPKYFKHNWPCFNLKQIVENLAKQIHRMFKRVLSLLPESCVAKQPWDIRLLYYGAWVSFWSENLKKILLKPASGKKLVAVLHKIRMHDKEHTKTLFDAMKNMLWAGRGVSCVARCCRALGCVSSFLINAAIVNFNISFRQPLSCPPCHWMSNICCQLLRGNTFDTPDKCQTPVTPFLRHGADKALST